MLPSRLVQTMGDRNKIVDGQRLGAGRGVNFKRLPIRVVERAFEIIAERFTPLGKSLCDDLGEICTMHIRER